jgi:hypothetical protein
MSRIDPLSGIRRSPSPAAAPARPANWLEMSARDQRTFLIEENLRQQREDEGREPAAAPRVPLPPEFHSWSAVTQRQYLLTRGNS